MAEKDLRSHMEWASSYGSVYAASLPDDILLQLRTDAASVAQCPNFWTPRVRLATCTQISFPTVSMHS